ncbi:multifunctional CCA addition/repair protein [Methyloterricola oryzae]|uniref:multifunctional CCA addition/repair protein n=1 Tax=Methyloterricola oryzae TaxID=1495050 RepID=UPI0005EB7017|nr:multifunctional CCA addition/repair protein [Methyloterricola oryzae]
MQIFLVGGAVRDRLLGLPVKERDWVVVGSTPEQMQQLGYRSVGRDFPVFLHPETREEYALARTERKTAPGYRGFDVDALPAVTLEQDLMRRDLTINAMALDSEDAIIDPYGGQRDLEQRLLRHVSPAFAEDPVRVLRVARFAARYAHLGFSVAHETLELMRAMAESGEVDALVAERVWAELVKALGERTPTAFFEVLREAGAMPHLFPELEALFGVPQPPGPHPEIDTGVHTLLVLEQATRLSPSPRVRFAALVHDLGKALTPPESWPRHHGHEKRGLAPLDALCERLKAPKDYRRLASQVMQYHGLCHRALELRPSTLVDLLQRLNALRPQHDLEAFLCACEADARGRTGLEAREYPQADHLRRAREAALSVDAEPFLRQGLSGTALGQAMREARIHAVRSQVCRAGSGP